MQSGKDFRTQFKWERFVEMEEKGPHEELLGEIFRTS